MSVPTTSHYDAIIVGARAAGSATAMGLARQGQRVLVIDRDRYGADTLSTHALQRVAVMLLEDWGLLDQLRATDTPPVRDVTFHYAGRDPLRIDLPEPLYAPRRTVLDPVLADAAVAAGAELRWRTRLDSLVRDDSGRVRGIRAVGPDGTVFEAHAPITIGADGRNSRVAAAVQAPVTRQGRTAGAYLYATIAGLRPNGYEWLFGPGNAAGLVPTNDDSTTVFVGGAATDFRAMARDRAGTFASILTSLAPDVASRVLAGRRVGPVRGFPGQPALLRRPHGPGWALVGDAGSFKDPISSHGITDAFKDAALLTAALGTADGTASSLAAACADYESTRDRFTLPLLDAVEPITTYAIGTEQLAEQHMALSACLKTETTAFRALLNSTPAPAPHEPRDQYLLAA